VADVLITRKAAEWREILTAAGLQNEVLQTYKEFVDHPQTKAIGLVTMAEQPGSDIPWPVPNPPGVMRAPSGAPEVTAPTLGQHTRAILSEIGYSPADIQRLFEQKVVTGA
jgi:CoA:oxalate CoA-transferase